MSQEFVLPFLFTKFTQTSPESFTAQGTEGLQRGNRAVPCFCVGNLLQIFFSTRTGCSLCVSSVPIKGMLIICSCSPGSAWPSRVVLVPAALSAAPFSCVGSLLSLQFEFSCLKTPVPAINRFEAEHQGMS